MADLPRNDDAPRRYEETQDPHNPPNSLLTRDTRRATVWSYFAPIVVLFVVIGVALVYWSNRAGARIPDPGRDQAAVGTVGSEQGGFDPAPKPGSASAEVERRGDSLTPLTRVRDLTAYAVPIEAGRRVELRDVKVDRAEGSSFWLADGDTRVEVIAMDGAAAVKPGAHVNVMGHVERGPNDTMRIRANRVDVK
jgi:hypothetical protein